MSELLNLFPRYDFERLVDRHQGNRYTKYFTAWQQLITILFSQVSGKDSLRDIETSLTVHHRKWYHIGFQGVKRSTLSDAINNRPAEIYEGLFYKLLAKCRSVTPQHKFKFKNPLYTLDSTVINLCLSIFPWAKYRKRKGAIKLHYIYDHSGAIPSFMVMTDGKKHDVRVAKSDPALNATLQPDSIISLDKAYIDYKWLYSLNRRNICFVTRIKNNADYVVTGQHQDTSRKAVIRDDEIRLLGVQTMEKYPEPLRLVGYTDPESNKYYEFLTNNRELPAEVIADIYKARWQIELFFKWIKQNLKIKAFLGTTPNAVMTQIWIAMCYYLVLAYIKYQTKYRFSLTELSRMIREVIMDRINLVDILALNSASVHRARAPVSYQMALF